MPVNASATFQVTGWDEKATVEFSDGAKVTRAIVTQTYTGDITGSSTIEYQMAYGRHGAVRFVGLEILDGAIGEHRGTIVIQHVGQFVDGTAKSVWMFVEGTGTDALAELGGEGTYQSIDQQTCSVQFSWHMGEAST